MGFVAVMAGMGAVVVAAFPGFFTVHCPLVIQLPLGYSLAGAVICVNH